MVLQRKQLYPKLLGYQSSLKVSSLRNYPFEFTLFIRIGSLSTIFTQYEHQVAVKQRPRYLYRNSFILPYCPDLLSTTLPKLDKQSKIAAIQLQFINIQFLSMIECPLCSQYTLEVYLHTTNAFIVCLDCSRLIDPLTKRNQYVFHTLLNFQISEQILQGNKKLKNKRLYSQQPFTKENISIKVSKLFSKQIFQKQDSESLTISTQESQGTKESAIKFQRPKMEAIKEKYDQTMKTINKEFQPIKQRFSRTKNTIVDSTKTFRNKMAQVRNNYSNFSAELPPISSIAIKSVKQGLGGFMSKFF